MAKDGRTEDVRNQPSFTECGNSGVPDDGYHTFRKEGACYRRRNGVGETTIFDFP